MQSIIDEVNKMSRPCPIYSKAIYLDCLECEDKVCKKESKKYDKIVIGIDQSYKNCGVSIAADGKLLKVKSINLEKYKSKTDKRRVLRERLNSLFLSVSGKSNDIEVIIERIRLRSQGFLNIDYIKSIGALNALITDESRAFSIPVYSVDTRAWKSQVIGSSKPASNSFGVPEEKWLTVKWLIEQGFEKDILIKIKSKRKNKGTFVRDSKKYMYNNDAADSAGIAMFGFVGKRENLKEEK
jgi:hypothetical protein